MDISTEWRNRHPRAPRQYGKVLVLILILVLVLIMILGSDTLASGFTALVGSPGAE